MSTLSDLLAEANRGLGLSVRKIAARAAEQGHRIDYSTVSLYLNGKHGEPDESTLAALAAALPVELEDLRRAAGLSAERTDPYEPPDVAARMTTRQRRAVDEIIRLLVRAESDGHDRTPPIGEDVSAESPEGTAPPTEASPPPPDDPRRRDLH